MTSHLQALVDSVKQAKHTDEIVGLRLSNIEYCQNTEKMLMLFSDNLVAVFEVEEADHNIDNRHYNYLTPVLTGTPLSWQAAQAMLHLGCFTGYSLSVAKGRDDAERNKRRDLAQAQVANRANAANIDNLTSIARAMGVRGPKLAELLDIVNGCKRPEPKDE